MGSVGGVVRLLGQCVRSDPVFAKMIRLGQEIEWNYMVGLD